LTQEEIYSQENIVRKKMQFCKQVHPEKGGTVCPGIGGTVCPE